MMAKRLVLLVCAGALAAAGSGCSGVLSSIGGGKSTQARAQTRDRIEQEEERLAELQGQIREHEARLQQYESGEYSPAEYSPMQYSAAQLPAPLTPAEMIQDPYADLYQDSRAGDRLGAFTHARIDMNDGSVEAGGSAGEEEILYQATGSQNLAAAYLNGTNAVQAQAPASPVPTRFAGAPVGRSNFSKPLPKTPQEPQITEGAGAQAKKPWENGHLFAAQAQADAGIARAKPIVPNMYESRQRSEETMWPAGTAMVPPAGTQNTLLAAQTAPRTMPKAEVRLPAAPARTAAPVAAQPRVDPDAGMDDEFFSPSMFLGGGL